MTNRLNVALALVAGLAGGLMTRYLGPPTVFAQSPAPQTPTHEIRARSFTLVDANDNTLGTFTAQQNGDGPQIYLRDSNGKTLWKAGGLPLVRPLSTAR